MIFYILGFWLFLFLLCVELPEPVYFTPFSLSHAMDQHVYYRKVSLAWTLAQS